MMVLFINVLVLMELDILILFERFIFDIELILHIAVQIEYYVVMLNCLLDDGFYLMIMIYQIERIGK